VIARPFEFGVAFLVILISIAFFANGIEMMVLGITKR
jgi:hypothetical protein